MNCTRCGDVCMTIELVRMPSPKKRTPLIMVPSVNAGCRKDDGVASRQVCGRVDPLHVGDAHRPASLLVLRLADDQPGKDLAVQTPHGRRDQHAFRGTTDAHHRMHTTANHRRRNARREIAVRESAGCAHRSCGSHRSTVRGARGPRRSPRDRRLDGAGTWRSPSGCPRPARPS